jgi:hypothetical protein
MTYSNKEALNIGSNLIKSLGPIALIGLAIEKLVEAFKMDVEKHEFFSQLWLLAREIKVHLS